MDTITEKLKHIKISPSSLNEINCIYHRKKASLLLYHYFLIKIIGLNMKLNISRHLLYYFKGNFDR